MDSHTRDAHIALLRERIARAIERHGVDAVEADKRAASGQYGVTDGADGTMGVVADFPEGRVLMRDESIAGIGDKLARRTRTNQPVEEQAYDPVAAGKAAAAAQKRDPAMHDLAIRSSYF